MVPEQDFFAGASAGGKSTALAPGCYCETKGIFDGKVAKIPKILDNYQQFLHKLKEEIAKKFYLIFQNSIFVKFVLNLLLSRAGASRMTGARAGSRLDRLHNTAFHKRTVSHK